MLQTPHGWPVSRKRQFHILILTMCVLFPFRDSLNLPRAQLKIPPIPMAEENVSKTFLDSACSKSKAFLEHCKESIADNVTPAISALNEAVEGVISSFRPSGKEHGPGANYGDL